MRTKTKRSNQFNNKLKEKTKQNHLLPKKCHETKVLYAGTNLEISDKGYAVIHSHSADEEVVLDELGVVIGKINHQVNMAITDQTAQGEMTKNDKRFTMFNIWKKNSCTQSAI